ncbi:hypothetical protein AB0N05_31475 [Nocardia sp. NPDC051030]|uniref:hypothetical protein n=1 Tax=Nocardia sp. NPDC051030 TaxID=3155162 RepID=UPI003439F7DB
MHSADDRASTRAKTLLRHPAARPLGFAITALAFVLLIVLLGVLIKPYRAVISTDRLGPENSEVVADYLTRAQNSLQPNDSTPRWSLISFTEAITPDRIPTYTGGLRISDVLYHVALDRVSTPIIDIPLPAGDAAALASVKTAAAQAESTPTFDDRSTRTKNVVATRLRANCACVVGIVVQGPLPDLRTLATHPGVRAVEALPADASAGVFALAPLLPEHRITVDPSPNDGPVPDN